MRALLVGLTLILCACGPARQQGDADGQPVAFQVTVTRAFTAQLESRARTRVGAGYAVGSSGYRSTGLGIGLSFSATTLTLEAVDANSEALIFRKRLSWGSNAFTIPLRSDRTLTLTLVVESNAYAAEPIGKITASAAQPIVITLNEHGSSLK